MLMIKGVTMQVSFNPNVSFKQQNTDVLQNKNSQPVVQQPAVTVVPAEKKSSGFREDLSKIAKFFTTMSEMTKAAIKAVGYGALTTATFLAGFWSFGTLPRAFKKGNSLIDAFKHPIKNISTKGKLITAAAGLGVAAYHIIKGKLASNQRTANVDHQLKTGHRDFAKF